MINVPTASKDSTIVSPISKPPNPVIFLLGNKDDYVTNSINPSSTSAKPPEEVLNDNSDQLSKSLIASKPVPNDEVNLLSELLIVFSKPADGSTKNDTDMAGSNSTSMNLSASDCDMSTPPKLVVISTDVDLAVATKNYPK